MHTQWKLKRQFRKWVTASECKQASDNTKTDDTSGIRTSCFSAICTRLTLDASRGVALLVKPSLVGSSLHQALIFSFSFFWSPYPPACLVQTNRVKMLAVQPDIVSVWWISQAQHFYPSRPPCFVLWQPKEAHPSPESFIFVFAAKSYAVNHFFLKKHEDITCCVACSADNAQCTADGIGAPDVMGFCVAACPRPWL